MQSMHKQDEQKHKLHTRNTHTLRAHTKTSARTHTETHKHKTHLQA